DLDRTHLDRVVGLDDISIKALRPSLDSRARHCRDAVQRAHEQARIHRHSRPEAMILIGELRLEAHGSRGAVDLVVHQYELTLGEGLLAIGGQGPDLELTLALGLQDAGKLRLGSGEDDGNRLDLSDLHDTARIGGMELLSPTAPATHGGADV